MDQKNVKKRDVLGYDEFIKAYQVVTKPVATKAGQNPDPGAHTIKGEDLYVRNDANPYKAFGIEHDEKIANASNNTNANQVDVYDGKAPGKDDGKTNKGKDKPTDPKTEKEQKKATEDAGAVVSNLTGGGLDEADTSHALKDEGLYDKIVKKYSTSEVLSNNIRKILYAYENNKVDRELTSCALAGILSISLEKAEDLIK